MFGRFEGPKPMEVFSTRELTCPILNYYYSAAASASKTNSADSVFLPRRARFSGNSQEWILFGALCYRSCPPVLYQ